jgi:hypothetical protein
MDIAFELVDLCLDPEPSIQEVRKTMNEVKRVLVALVDKRVVTLNDFDSRIPFPQWGEIGIMLPQGIAGCSDIRLKFIGTA